MADVIMPQMGESIAEGTITKWMKNVGDKIVRDEPLFEISTDKVDAEIPAPASGYLQEIRVPPGTTVPINTVVAIIQEGDAPAATPEPPAISLVPPAAPPPPPPQPPLPALVPLAETAPPPVVLAPAPPAAVAPPAPAIPAPTVAPTPPPPPAPPTAIAMTPPPPSAPLEPSRPTPPPPPSAASALPSVAARPAPEPPAAPPRVPPEPAPAPTAAPMSAGPTNEKPRSEMTVDELRRARSSPVVRNIAAEHNVDITQVPGTGVSGRVTKQDILSHLESRPTAGAPPAAAPTGPAPEQPIAAAAPAAVPLPPTPAVPAYHPGERVQVIPMSPIRKKTAEHMVLSKRVSAHVSTVFEVDMSRLAHLRHKYRAAYEERSGIKLTYTPFILKATVDALKAFPVLNSSVDGDAIVYKKDINLGIAVALDWGLIVPVIRNADEKNVLGLARAVSDLADRARTKKLKVEEIQGGTFTVTNPGVFGSLFGTPIINQPQVGILGVGTIEKRPVVRDDAIAIRTMAYLALTFDHRIVDGADADRFMAHLKKGLQEFDESAM